MKKSNGKPIMLNVHLSLQENVSSVPKVRRLKMMVRKNYSKNVWFVLMDILRVIKEVVTQWMKCILLNSAQQISMDVNNANCSGRKRMVIIMKSTSAFNVNQDFHSVGMEARKTFLRDLKVNAMVVELTTVTLKRWRTSTSTEMTLLFQNKLVS